ncbi:MAG: hypothetical protein HYV26_19970 [Candidatus Hydrogenedentes bacterium]|nr:hypothetical protein [Candidatus Hydrogenedentota bacterium]
MLSLIEVKCPHCGAQGQIMLPPLGAIIIGPCPECEGMVVVFCGRVLPLDKTTMMEGSLEEKRDHLMQVLTSFLQDRIERLFAQAAAAAEQASEQGAAEGMEDEDQAMDFGPEARPPMKQLSIPISEEELSNFINVDLRLLDNTDYFKAVFD